DQKWGPLSGYCFGNSDHSRLRRSMANLARSSIDSGSRSDIDDFPVHPLASSELGLGSGTHERRSGADALERPFHSHVHHEREPFIAHAVDHGIASDTGVVNQDI